MAIVLTYTVTLDDEELIGAEARVAALMRMMAHATENSEHSKSPGFSVGRNFECIKLISKETV